MNDFLSHTLLSLPPASVSGENQYVHWQWIMDGVIQFEPKHAVRRHVLLSAGIHGNETAPIEILNQYVTALYRGDICLGVRLLVVFGNTNAMREGKRFIQMDLNRMFHGLHQNYPPCYETQRAQELEHIVMKWFASAPDERWHFDMHTAIRRSHHLRFGLLPQRVSRKKGQAFIATVCAMGLDAIVLNPTFGGTFSYFTSTQCQALSCTLELGKAKPFGTNELGQFAEINQALAQIMTCQTPISAMDSMNVYRVSRELTKHAEDFHFLGLGNAAKNFTRFARGTLIAMDSTNVYQVEHPHEWLIFPNPHVHKGLRAGILLEKVTMNAVLRN